MPGTETGPAVDPEIATEKRYRQVIEPQEDAPEASTPLPEADQAPDPTAPAEITASDEAGIAKLHANDETEATEEISGSLDGLDSKQRDNLVAQRTAEQAREVIQGTAPGSDEEQKAYQAMKDARRSGSMTVDGLAPKAPEATQDPVVGPEAPTDTAVPPVTAPTTEKKGMFSWLRSLGRNK